MDASLLRRINALADHTSYLHAVAADYATYGIVLFAALLVAAWLRARSRGDLRAEAGIGWTGIATLISLGLGQVIGHAVRRARPYTAMPTMHVLVAKTNDFSFPSDHGLAVGAIAVGLWLIDRPVGTVAVGLALLMAFVRVYVGVHYPADVLAGLLIAGLVTLLGSRLAVNALHPLLAHANRIPGAPIITGHPRDEAGIGH